MSIYRRRTSNHIAKLNARSIDGYLGVGTPCFFIRGTVLSDTQVDGEYRTFSITRPGNTIEIEAFDGYWATIAVATRTGNRQGDNLRARVRLQAEDLRSVGIDCERILSELGAFGTPFTLASERLPEPQPQAPPADVLMLHRSGNGNGAHHVVKPTLDATVEPAPVVFEALPAVVEPPAPVADVAPPVAELAPPVADEPLADEPVAVAPAVVEAPPVPEPVRNPAPPSAASAPSSPPAAPAPEPEPLRDAAQFTRQVTDRVRSDPFGLLRLLGGRVRFGEGKLLVQVGATVVAVALPVLFYFMRSLLKRRRGGE